LKGIPWAAGCSALNFACPLRLCKNQNRTLIVYTTIVLTLVMSLEDDIQQQKFGSEHQKAAINVLFTASWLHSGNAARLKKHGITPEQYNVLRILRGSHPKKMMLAEITRRMIDKSSNATRLVEKLRQKNLVEREQCEDNRRQVDINITGKGLELMKSIDSEENHWIETLKGISKTEAAELNRILDKLRD
jgi:DNA-binding MarR family transcriptional regulator